MLCMVTSSLDHVVGAGDGGGGGGVLAVPVDDSHPAAVGDMSHQAESLRSPAAVDPTLGEVPAGGDEQHVVQAGNPSSGVSPLLTDKTDDSQWPLTLQLGRLICLQTSSISAVVSVWRSHTQLELPELWMVPRLPGLSLDRQEPQP